MFLTTRVFSKNSSVDLSRVKGLFDRTLLYRYELLSSFPPTLIIIFYERDTHSKMMMMRTLPKIYKCKRTYKNRK